MCIFLGLYRACIPTVFLVLFIRSIYIYFVVIRVDYNIIKVDYISCV